MRLSRALRPRLRPAARAPRRQRVLRGLAAAVALAAVGAGAWAITTGRADALRDDAVARLQEASVAAGLGVDKVIVMGRQRTASDALLDALGVARGTSMLAVDPAAARARLEDLPWIERARVARQFPGTLRVRVREREPMAVWRRPDGKSARLLDWNGEPIRGVAPDAFPDLLRVRGADAPAHTHAFIRAIQARPALAKRVARARRVAGRRWRVIMANGVVVDLPADDPTRAWTRLARLEREKRLLQRAIERVDLRLEDRVVVERGRPEARADHPSRRS